MLKASIIREMGADQVKVKLAELKQELFNLRFRNEIGQLENTAILSFLKKDIARLYTISKEKGFNLN